MQSSIESPPMPPGEVIATGEVDGVHVEVIRWTRQDLERRDAFWRSQLQRLEATLRAERCSSTNLRFDLRRVLAGEPTLCSFPEVEEVRARLNQDADT